jgi:hypothetical protein
MDPKPPATLQPPTASSPLTLRRQKTRSPVSVSETGERNAQEANRKGKNIIRNYDVKGANKNYIGFVDNSISEDLGSTTTLDNIYLNNFNYSGEKIVNMSLTKIKEESDKEYLFSIKLDDVLDDESYSSINNFLQSVNDDVKTYLLGTTDNKIDFANLYEVTDKKQLPTSLSLKYILFIGNGEIDTIEWNNEDVGGDDISNIKSFKYETIILIYSSTTNFAGIIGINKIDEINKKILSKEALFCIYFIDFITFTADMFKKLIPTYKEDEAITGGNKVVKKKRKNKFPKK